MIRIFKGYTLGINRLCKFVLPHGTHFIRPKRLNSDVMQPALGDRFKLLPKYHKLKAIIKRRHMLKRFTIFIMQYYSGSRYRKIMGTIGLINFRGIEKNSNNQIYRHKNSFT
ncbi:hypothetical protein BpHYR1_048811 [Brachionus plicatilis]|uniref:Uncharacterized protein n=1 Tax=Brachionus plicatilis TaxID=10195 RepID=A0A3M7SN25_BRAPC|nr:hypothetical protein BpHYR1_048811 [Brachionus plicatilis]